MHFLAPVRGLGSGRSGDEGRRAQGARPSPSRRSAGEPTLLLIAELTDNDGWSTLIDQSENMGTSDLTERFRRALSQERDHLQKVRTWLRERLNVQIVGQADVGAHPSQPQA